MFTLTALEELFTLAKNFDAEVVYCEKFYKATSDLSKIVIDSEQQGSFVDKPTFESEDLPVRVREYLHNKFLGTAWCKFVRRKLLIDNEIFFPHCKISEDDIWTCGLVFYAERFLRVPNAVYVYRLNKESALQKSRTPEQILTFWLNPVIFGMKALENILSKLEFFRQNPDRLYALLEGFVLLRMNVPITFRLPYHHVYAAIKDEFGAALGEQDILVSTLCTIVNTQLRAITVRNQRIAELERKLEEKF